MNTKENLERLLDDSQYYGDFGRQFLSNSDVGDLLKDPRGFRHPREDNKSFAEGRYFHQSLLEPEKAANFPFVDASSRNTLVYKDAIALAEVPVMLLKKEKEELDRIVSIMRGNLWFYEQMYQNENRFEVPGITKIQGAWWKGKADIVSKDYIIDLKTTRSIEDFPFKAKAYNYDSQAYIYQTLFDKPFVFFAIEKGSGKMGVFYASEDFVMSGKRKVERAMEVYEKFFGENATYDIDQFFVKETL